MSSNKLLALELRKKNKSYNEIVRLLKIPKSTLHYWLKDNPESRLIKNKLNKNRLLDKKQIALMNRIRGEKWEKWRNQFRVEAIKEFKSLKNNPLFISGISLYWGEGDKILKNGIVRLINTDYRMIGVFYKFLKTICKIPDKKIVFCLFIYPDLSDLQCKKFWSGNIGFDSSQFRKTQVITGKNNQKRVGNGMCSIQVYSRGLKEKLIEWINIFAKNQ